MLDFLLLTQGKTGTHHSWFLERSPTSGAHCSTPHISGPRLAGKAHSLAGEFGSLCFFVTVTPVMMHLMKISDVIIPF